jgi:hypothetical protein
MPIVYPPSFKLEFLSTSTHIRRRPAIKTHGRNSRHQNKEFHAYNTIPVLGYEGSWLKVDGDKIIVRRLSARL